MSHDDSLAAILLLSRVGSDEVRPLKASEFWGLCDLVGGPSLLLGADETQLVSEHGLAVDLATRIVELLDRATAMAFELERLGQAGISTLTPFDEHYPRRFVDRLGAAAPALMYAAGTVELLDNPGVGVVGSRNVSPDGAEVAGAAAERAAHMGLPLISGGARGVDQIAMNAAFGAGGGVVGVLAESLVRKLRSPDVRRAIHEGRTVMCTPYNPEAPFSVGNAMGRNRLIYALSRITLVVASEVDEGGTWSGAAQALKGGIGRVAVWRGPGEGPGNARLEALGALPVTSLDELEAAVLEPAEPAGVERLQADRPSPAPQPTLFD